jgi:hypothetical protein
VIYPSLSSAYSSLVIFLGDNILFVAVVVLPSLLPLDLNYIIQAIIN